MSNNKPNKTDLEQYDIPEDVAELFDQYAALYELRNRYIEKKRGFKNAKKCAIQAMIVRRKFWKAVHDLYPELVNEEIEYNPNTKKINVI